MVCQALYTQFTKETVRGVSTYLLEGEENKDQQVELPKTIKLAVSKSGTPILCLQTLL